MKLNFTQSKESKILFPLNIYNPNAQIKFLIIKEVVFLFINFEILIYKFENEEIVYETKKNLDILSLEEQIISVESEDKNTNILIATNIGNIYILHFNMSDFYFEIIYHLNIRHNFIHEYEILFFCEMNILMTIDKHLFHLELLRVHLPITNNYDTDSATKNNLKTQGKKHPALTPSFNVIKNLLLRIQDVGEKILSAYLKIKSYVVIQTNKAIYYINYQGDGANEIIFKKDEAFYKFNYSGFVFQDILYYVKDSNTFSVYHFYDPQHKFTVKLSAKNQLNDLNFFKVLNVTNDLITIINEKETEMYFINNKYKLIHRESILFDKTSFLFFNFKVYLITLNIYNSMIKYKVGNIINNASPHLYNPEIDKKNENFDFKEINLSKIEKVYVQFINSKFEIQMKKNFFISRIKSHIRNLKFLKNYENFIKLKNKIIKNVSHLLIICPNFKIQKVLKSITLIYIYQFGSYSLKKSFYVLFFIYFTNIYESRIKSLMKISWNIKDKIVYNELFNLLKLLKLLN